MGGFPQLNIGNRTSPDVQPIEQPVPTAEGGMVDQLREFGDTLGQLADKAAAYKGQQAGAADALAGKVTPQNPLTVYGASYNDIAKQTVLTQSEAAMTQQMGEIYAQHPDNPAELGKALEQVRAGFGKTGFADVDAQLQGRGLIRQAGLMAQAADAYHQRMVQSGQSDFIAELDSQKNLVDQTAAGAHLDGQGYARIAASLDSATRALVRYGPKVAFDVGAQHYDADETRLGALEPQQIEEQLVGLRSEAKRTWILNQGLTLPDAASKEAYRTDLEARYKAGDPLLKGINGNEWDVTMRRLEADASRTGADQRVEAERHAQNARQMIESLQWGGAFDPVSAQAEARASGDPGLQAQVAFYSQADAHVRGVLKSVVARQLGLIGPQDSAEWLDSAGNPVAPPAGAPAKPGAAMPAMHDPAGALAGMLGGPVTITSTARSLAHNAAVGGVPDSYHLSGHAADFTPPPGMTTAEAAAKLKASGAPFVELLDEGTHVHVAWNGPSAGAVWSPPTSAAPGSPAFAAWANTKEGFSADPLEFARGNQTRPAIASVPPLLPDGFASQDPTAVTNWAHALQGRAALARQLAQTYAVPERMLTNGERAYYESALAKNPGAAVGLAQASESALGPTGALQFMREVHENSQGADVALHLADLHLMGNDRIVQSAMDGLQLQAQGAKEPSFRNAPGATPDTTWDNASLALAPALKYAPEALQAARRVAQLAHISDTAKGVQGLPAAYLQSALGSQSVNGRQYGGVGRLNGALTLLPAWLSVDRAPDVLGQLGADWAGHATGPRWANGQVVDAAAAAKLQLVYRPNGHYWLVQPGSNQVLRGAGGAPFELDLDRARPYLKRTVPDAVLPGR